MEKSCPLDILEQITSVEVNYVDFNGTEKSGMIEVNKKVAHDVLGFFELAKKINFPIARVASSNDSEFAGNDNKLMATNVSSGFNYRVIAGTDKLSLHSYGMAFDINPAQNPYVRYRDNLVTIESDGVIWDPTQPGTLYAEHPLVQFMTSRGWEWGGNWLPKSGRTDYQHFQKSK